MNFYDEMIDKIAAGGFDTADEVYTFLHQIHEKAEQTYGANYKENAEYQGQVKYAHKQLRKFGVGDPHAGYEQWKEQQKAAEEAKHQQAKASYEQHGSTSNGRSGGWNYQQHTSGQGKRQYESHFGGRGYSSYAHDDFRFDSAEALKLINKAEMDKLKLHGIGFGAALAAVGLSNLASAKSRKEYAKTLRDASKVDGRHSPKESSKAKDAGAEVLGPYALYGMAGGIAAGALLSGAVGKKSAKFAEEYNKLISEGKTKYPKGSYMDVKETFNKNFKSSLLPLGLAGAMAGAAVGGNLGYPKAIKKVQEYKQHRDKAASYMEDLEKEALGLPKIPVPKVVQSVNNKINDTAIKAYTKVNSHPVGREFINDVHKVLGDPSGVGPDNLAGLGIKWAGHGAQHVYDTVNSFEHYPGVKPIVKKIFNPPKSKGWVSPEQYDTFHNYAGEESSALQKLALMGEDKARENFENAGLRYISEDVDPYAEEWYDKTKLDDANAARDVMLNKYQTRYSRDGALLGAGTGGLIGGFVGRKVSPGIGSTIGAAVGGAAGVAGGGFLGYHAGTAKGYNQTANVLNAAADDLEAQEYLEETKE